MCLALDEGHLKVGDREPQRALFQSIADALFGSGVYTAIGTILGLLVGLWLALSPDRVYAYYRAPAAELEAAAARFGGSSNTLLTAMTANMIRRARISLMMRYMLVRVR